MERNALTPRMWELVDNRTGQVIRRGTNATTLRTAAHKRNSAWGAHRFHVRAAKEVTL